MVRDAAASTLTADSPASPTLSLVNGGGPFAVFKALPEYNRANRLYDVGRYEAAFLHYDQAVQLKPDWFSAWLRRGNSLRNLERYKTALASYDRAIKLKPENYWGWTFRGITLSRLER
ncbi:MAG: tetratricopeptide repeat protein [Microcoleaceae cyanobacterium]